MQMHSFAGDNFACVQNIVRKVMFAARQDGLGPGPRQGLFSI